ncbi:MAG: Fic family protein [Candidatus Micrarchaeota archaeon]|nr:Fic family protein [Candidatus Micrarchaeota archaeon]
MPIKQRKVKGKIYFYFEKNIRIGENSWKTFSIYIGSTRPTAPQLKILTRKLEKIINLYVKKEIQKTKTKYINVKTALKLERIRTSHKMILVALDHVSRENYLKRQREQFITNTNAIEGSQLTFEQTKKILELKKQYEAQDKEELEVINMEKCLELYDGLILQKIDLDIKIILRFHMLLLKAIPSYEGYAGVWRPVNVYIRGSKYDFPAWKDISELMKNLLRWYDAYKNELHPVELAATFHAKFVTIHPFADGNGRMARLLMNYILQLRGFPFIDIPFSKRDEYFETQEKGHFAKYEPFVKFLVNEIKIQFTELKKKQKTR